MLSVNVTLDHRSWDEHLHEIGCANRTARHETAEIITEMVFWVLRIVMNLLGRCSRKSVLSWRKRIVKCVLSIIYVDAKRILTLIRWCGIVTLFSQASPNIFQLIWHLSLLDLIVLKNIYPQAGTRHRLQLKEIIFEQILFRQILILVRLLSLLCITLSFLFCTRVVDGNYIKLCLYYHYMTNYTNIMFV